MGDEASNGADEITGVDLATVIFGKLVLMPLFILGSVAFVSLAIGNQLGAMPEVTGSEMSAAINTFPSPTAVVILAVTSLILLYGHFYTDYPVLEIATGSQRMPRDEDE